VRVLRTRTETAAWRATVERVGFVPTMGALHEGHLSLVERAIRETDAAVVSIFVNPTQFGPHEDFTKYPRQEAKDLAMLERAGIAAAFVPSVDEMYPKGDKMRVDPGAIAEPLEGAARPGHFIGVATVVAKLFEIVRPTVAYFGQKDFQQLRVLQTMARERYPAIRVVGCPIVREPDGLAMSSRNAYLAPDERKAALALSRGLFGAGEAWARGTRDPERLLNRVRDVVEAEPRVKIEYIAISDPMTLAELRLPANRAVVSLAARVGQTRLIDNVLLGMDVSQLS
jgi:pantoate--beta-alanine ligase